mgnify:CR=1 FL=1
MGEIFSCLSQFRHLCKGARMASFPELQNWSSHLLHGTSGHAVGQVFDSHLHIVFIVSPWYLILLLFDYVKVTDTTSARM